MDPRGRSKDLLNGIESKIISDSGDNTLAMQSQTDHGLWRGYCQGKTTAMEKVSHKQKGSMYLDDMCFMLCDFK